MNNPGRFLISLKKLVLPVLIFLIPSQLGYHFWPDFAHVFGIRVDYFSPTIYLTDALIVLLFISWAATKPKIKKKAIFWIIALFLFAAINVSLAQNIGAAIYKWIKVFEFIFLGYYFSSIRALDIKRQIIVPLTFSILLFSSIGILQFLKQGALGGALYFLGERSFSVSSPGIALVDIYNRQYLRAYSTFSHPNSFAGFLAIGLIFLTLFKENKRLKTLAFALGTVAFLLSFSLGAFVGLGAVLFFYLITRILLRTLKKSLMALFFLAVFLSMLMALYSEDYLLGANLPEEFHNRLVLAEASGKLFSLSPVWGVGLNNFIARLPEIKLVSGVSWWLQPVHNIFLLILTETGILGLLAFMFLIIKALVSSVAKNKTVFGLALVFIVITGIFDHYWLTLQQNQLLLSLVLGLSLRKSR